MKQTNADGSTITTSYDMAGQPVSVTDANGNTAVTQYDNVGRGIKLTTPFNNNTNAETKTYYDKNSNVIKTAVKRAASYTYNANNLRASKKVNGTKTEFTWNGQNLAKETNSSGTNVYTYDMTGIHIANNNNGTIQSCLKDSHGNVVGMADANGSKNGDVFEYTAYGENLANVPAPFGYCGEYYDSESGLIYLRNRYYNTSIGRFITEDPIKDGLNWYGYCSGNPVMFVDPWGFWGELVHV